MTVLFKVLNLFIISTHFLKVCSYVLRSDLTPLCRQRESALLELSKKREAFPDLAPILWYSHGTIAALIQEVVSIYPMLSPPTLSPTASNRVCNALALLQCVASHPETKSKLMNGMACQEPCLSTRYNLIPITLI